MIRRSKAIPRSLLQSVLVWVAAGFASPALALDSHGFVERAVALIEAGEHALARNYLEPALIDFRLSAGERSRAYYLRGYSFFDQGMYVSAVKDYNRALEFHPGNPVVLSALAQMYLEGLGVAQNADIGVAFLEQAAQADHPPARMRLGVAYLRGLGVKQDVELAREWLTQAAEAGLAPAMVYLGLSYRAPYADPPVPGAARQWLEKARAAGSADAVAHLGFMAESGEGGETGPEEAIEHFKQAAAAGSGVAQARMAHAYLTGEGVEADPQRAVSLFRQAAANGHPTGYMGLGYVYETGTGVAQDGDEARRWYEKAAAAGMVDAQLHMAYLGLRRGDLDGQQQAGMWLSRAAAQNSVQALNDYAWLLATSEFDAVRNGQQALTLALQAVERKRSAAYLDTLAAAYAETGKFERAVATQREAMELAGDGDAALSEELERHLRAFEAGEAWRE